MTQEHDAEAAGSEYAQDQIENDYFMGWVREQMLEASRMDPSTVLPLETTDDARVIARNMLKQLEEDTKRGLDPREIASLIGVDSTTHDDVKEFFKGFSDTLRMNDAWLAGELLEINREMRGGGVSEARQGINRDKIQRALSYVHYWESSRAGTGRKTRADAALEAIRGEGLNDAETDILLRSIHVDRDEVLAARTARKEGKGGVGEARRRAQPLVDTKLYSVTWAGGRQGNLTDREAVDLVRHLRNDWVEAGRNGILNIQVWYRDGSLVPYADLERQFYPTGSPIPGRSGFTSEAHRGGRPSQRRGGVSEASRSGATKVKWVANGYDDGFHASVGQYFLKTMPVGDGRFVWSVSKGTKIVAGSEAVDPSWHGGYKGDPSEHGARVAAELAMTLHKTRSSRTAAVSESRRGPTPVEDPEYVIQGAYSDGRITESFGFDDEDTARSEAWKLSKSPYFEGDHVRIITRDGELVWDSRGRGVSEARRPKARRPVRRRR